VREKGSKAEKRNYFPVSATFHRENFEAEVAKTGA